MLENSWALIEGCPSKAASLELSRDDRLNLKKKKPHKPRGQRAQGHGPLLHPALLRMALRIYILSFLLVKQKSTICATTFRFQETEMRTDVVFRCMFSFRLLPFMRDSIFVITLFKENIYLELFFFPKWLPKFSKAWVFFRCKTPVSQKWRGFLRLVTKLVSSCLVETPWHPAMAEIVLHSTPIPKLSAPSKYRLRFYD